eukprot:3365790-Amphidinium_carterae.1
MVHLWQKRVIELYDFHETQSASGVLDWSKMPKTEPDADDVENLREMKPAAAKRLERVQCLLP